MLLCIFFFALPALMTICVVVRWRRDGICMQKYCIAGAGNTCIARSRAPSLLLLLCVCTSPLLIPLFFHSSTAKNSSSREKKREIFSMHMCTYIYFHAAIFPRCVFYSHFASHFIRFAVHAKFPALTVIPCDAAAMSLTVNFSFTLLLVAYTSGKKSPSLCFAP